MFWFPGWDGSFDLNKLSHYNLTFQFNLDIGLLCYYIRRGEYIFDIPFGVFSRDNATFLIAAEDPTDEIILGRNIGTIGTEMDVIWDSQSFQALSELAITTFYHVLSENGYTRPIDTRTFLGRRSKGVTSNPACIKSEIIEFDGIQREIGLFEAEKFFAWSYQDKFQVSHFPRYEFRDLTLHLPQTQEILEFLQEKWKDDIYMTPNDIITRSKKIDGILREELKRISFIHNISKRPHFKCKKLSWPCLVDPMGIELRLNPDISLKKSLLTRTLQLVKEDTLPISIQPIFDESILHNSIQLDIIENFLQNFKAQTGINYEPYLTSEQITELTLCDVSVFALIFLNDSIPGSSFIYANLKDELQIPSKALRYSTIETQNSWTEQMALLWLTMKHRHTKELIWQIPEDDYQPIVALVLRPEFQREAIVLSGTISYRDVIYQKLLLLPQTYDNGISSEQLIAFITDLNIYEIPLQDLLIIYEDRIGLEPLLISLQNTFGFPLVHIEDAYGRILEIDSGKFVHPSNGAYFQVIANNCDNYLLITNGRPDEPERGLPRPISVRIRSPTNNSIDILNEIYSHTFLHPASLIKTRVPIELHFARKNCRFDIKDPMNSELFLQVARGTI